MIVYALTCTLNSYCQDTITLTGTVKDFYTKRLLPFANISIKNTYIGTTTNMQGKFALKIPENILPVELSASFIGYDDTSVVVSKTRNQNCNFILYPKNIDINEITVNSEKNVIFGNSKYQILDFILHENKFLIICFKKRLINSFILMVDMQGKKLTAKPIKGKPIQLYTDCVNQPFLVCQSYPYMIHIKDTAITFQKAFQDKFNRLLKPCVASIDKTLYYKYMGPFDLSVQYYRYYLPKNEFEFFTRIDDDFQQEMFVDDFNYLLKSSGIKIMGNTNNYDALKRFRQKDLEEMFRFNMFHHPIYAPMFAQNDTIIIFNHPNGKIDSYDPLGTQLNSIPINYEQKKGWMPNILYDAYTKDYYTLITKNGISTFYKINLKTGETQKATKVDYTWIERPVINNNTVYFLHRRKDKNGARYLYYKDLNED